MTIQITPSALCDRIDAIITEKSILKHPFYTRWQAGELTLDELKGYACQYYHHVLAFPKYVSGTHANCDDLADLPELLENLREEEEGPNNHPELWLKFGEAIGLQREDITDVVIHDEHFASGERRISPPHLFEHAALGFGEVRLDAMEK